MRPSTVAPAPYTLDSKHCEMVEKTMAEYQSQGIVPALYWYFDFDDTIVRISDSERNVDGRLLFNPHLVDSIVK